MGAVTLHEVGHERGQLIGIECQRCMRHAMLSSIKSKAKVWAISVLLRQVRIAEVHRNALPTPTQPFENGEH